MRTDGNSGVVQVSNLVDGDNDSFFDPVTFGNYVYFVDGSTQALHKVDFSDQVTDVALPTLDFKARSIFTAGGQLYVVEDTTSTLYVLTKDGSTLTQISDESDYAQFYITAKHLFALKPDKNGNQKLFVLSNSSFSEVMDNNPGANDSIKNDQRYFTDYPSFAEDSDGHAYLSSADSNGNNKLWKYSSGDEIATKVTDVLVGSDEKIDLIGLTKSSYFFSNVGIGKFYSADQSGNFTDLTLTDYNIPRDITPITTDQYYYSVVRANEGGGVGLLQASGQAATIVPMSGTLFPWPKGQIVLIKK